MVLEIKNYINGQFVSPISGDYIDSISPATGVLNAKVPCSDKHDVDEAVSSAKRAFSSWSESSTKERADVMNRIADILESRLTEFARLESEDQAMLLATKIDIPRAVYNFRFFALSILNGTEECTHLTGASQHLNYVHRMPVGVAGLISPWNLPLYLLTWKIAPAIAFGNTCVAKPSELTSVTAWKLCEVFTAAKLPPGVVNIVFGYGTEVGEELVRHPDVSVVSFTGSTMVGQRISQVVAPYCKAVSLELGGKNAALVFGDADVNESVECCVRSSFANQVRKYIDIAISDGGTIKCGYGVEPLELPHKLKGGFFFPPTVITGVDDMSSCVQDEIFGPVVCIMPFDTEQEAIKRANNVKYGLCATVWTTHLERAHRVSKKLEAGTVWVNCWMVRDLRMPFGGMKHSGLGRESAKDSLEFFTEAKTICIKY
uniref:Aldehyde dehydrogenase domain-containing protein n=1 Tax=Ciona savignyi TaxID=51511 RepID=H2ZDD0_CIOSA